MEQRRIGTADIVVGQPLPWDVFDANNHLLLRRGQIVQRMQQVESLIARGMFVIVSQSDKTQLRTAQAAAQVQERPSALRLINLANKRLERLLFGLHTESEVHAKLAEVAKAIGYAINVNPDVALGSILLNQESAGYPVRHSMDTAIVAMLVARAMNKKPEDVEKIALAALTMNVGMLRHHDEFHQRTQALSEQEMETVKNHPKESVEQLRQAGIEDDELLDYVLLHHENEDGSGYPLGKSSQQIPENAKILALADRYCARVSVRNYRKTMLPNAALRDILLAEKKNIDPMLATCFIRELGTYPTGTHVRLQNGEIGIVTGRGNSTTTPVVHALIGPRGAPLSFPIRRETHKELYAVREVLHDTQAAVRVSMQQLWGVEAAL